MCNLYSHTKGQQAIIELARAMVDRTGNLPSQPGVFPDYAAPTVRNSAEGRKLVVARWGMPSSQKALFDAASKRDDKLRANDKPVDFPTVLKMEPDAGTTNIRNTASAHWRRWLGPENRCVVPFTSFSEFNKVAGGDIWFALDESRPLAFFAGLWTSWTSVRKVCEGESPPTCSGASPRRRTSRWARRRPKRSSCSGRCLMARSSSWGAAHRKIAPARRINPAFRP